MGQCATPTVAFARPSGPIEACFNLDQLTGDGGLLWLAEAEDDLGLCAAMADVIPDWRRGPARHSLASLVRQRVFQIVCGWVPSGHDQNDATTLRHDPLLQLSCDYPGALVSQSTLSRLDNAHASWDAVAEVARIVAAMRGRWPGVTIDLRADGGFAVPELYGFCEAEQIEYTMGLIPNPRLEEFAAPLLALASLTYAHTQQAVRLIGQTRYQAESWPHPRRVIIKAEVREHGTITRFVVTTRKDAPEALYDWYIERGETEN